jgi:formylglycine-generating enzyme required for sulfatase activity
MARKVALLIGVGEYGDGLKPLRCPVNGVRTLTSILESPDIGQFNQVIPLENPDVGTMQTRIGEVFAQLAKPDLVLFYFTGHGIKDMDGSFYLTTAQTQLFENNRPNPGTAVEAGFLKRVITNCAAERKVIILDCCFGAAFADGFLGMDDSGIDVEAQLGGKGWCVLTAATSRRYALEQEGEDLSVYTRYLVEGLKTGGAAPEGQELISVRHLHNYIEKNVKIAAPAMEPAIFNAKQGDEIVLAKAYLDSEQVYRKQVQEKVRGIELRPSAQVFLKLQQLHLKLTDEQARAIEAEVLKPYREKQRHLESYAFALKAEKDYMLKAGYTLPLTLDDEAVEDLKDIQQLLNLRDEDVQALEREILGEVVPSQVPKRTASEPPPASQPAPAIAADLPAPVTPQQYPTFRFETVKVNDQGQVSETLPGEADYFAEDLGNGVVLEMVRIPGGTFLMGAAEGEAGASKDEYPQHEVTVPEFWMGKYAVTQEQWKVVAGLEKVKRTLEADPARFKGAKHPVEQVSWAEAVEFCDRLSRFAETRISRLTNRDYRLPTEAEWEYACRAGTTTPFYFGPTITADLANYDASSTYGNGPKGKYRQKTIEVGNFPPNAFGLYDMHGNVWEWCLDDWHDSYKGVPTDGSAWLKSGGSKLRRGGSWGDYPLNCRAADRLCDRPDDRGLVIGFRVVCVSPRTLQ